MAEAFLPAALEIGDRSLSEREGACVGDRAFDGPAGAGNEGQRLARESPEAQARADHSDELEGALAVDLLAVRRREPKHHADLIEGEGGQIGSGNEDGRPENPVQALEAPHDLFADGAPD